MTRRTAREEVERIERGGDRAKGYGCGEQPSWRRPVARIRWMLNYRRFSRYAAACARLNSEEDLKSRSANHEVAVGDWMAPILKKRSDRLRDKLNGETDLEACEADMLNGFPLWTVQRRYRNRDGDQ